jgi:hypothetical protein
MHVHALIESIASTKFTYGLLLAACVAICALCGIEGGFQLHLSHDHPALGCVVSYMSQGDNALAPPCRLPDVRGQAWRLRLVELDMLGFVTFGAIGLALVDGRKTVKVAARRATL